MKKCNMCDNQVEDNISTCPKCGNQNLIQVENQVQSQMPQQPMSNKESVNNNMSMTFATVFMVILGIGILGSVINLLSEFSIENLIDIAFSGATLYFLYKRAKVGRILAMIMGIFDIIGGALVAIGGIVFMAGSTYLSAYVDIDLTSLGTIFGFIMIALGGGIIAYGICTFIYFKKRISIYIN